MRENLIVSKLIEARKTIRIKDLSKELEVSTRTIKYDLENIRKWLEQFSIEIYAQPNKGLWLECSENEKLRLYRAMIENKNESFYVDQHARLERILYMFFVKEGYITASQLANQIQVSRNTIINDLKAFEEFIQPWMLRLERKQRKGYRIVGKEIHLRLLTEHIIRENVSDYDMYHIFTSIQTGKIDELSLNLDDTILSACKNVMKQSREILLEAQGESISHVEILSIFIRLTIMLVRMDCGCTIGSYRLFQSNDASSSFLEKLMAAVCTQYQVPMLEDEFHYVHRNFLLDQKLDLVKITNQIIHYVSKKEGVPYVQDVKLYGNLLAHLSLRFEKSTTYLTEINPFKEEIKNSHFSLFSHIRDACLKYIGPYTSIVHDSFISFITLHFLVSYENVFKKKPCVTALYVCSTGRGVARLIKNRVEREIKQIEIAAYCSMLEVEERMKEQDIDFIISVFPLKANVPVIIVDSVPSEENIRAIREAVYEIIQETANTSTAFLQQTNQAFEEEKNNEEISQEIILKGFEIAHEMMNAFGSQLHPDRKEGFMIHLFLMVHRFYFNKQYDHFMIRSKEKHQTEQLLEQLDTVLKKNHVSVNKTELISLSQYFK